MQDKFPDTKRQARWGHLGSLGIKENLAAEPLHPLSGGQLARMAVALYIFKVPHLLVLDESTNHLDLLMVDTLIAAPKEYAEA